VISGKCKCLSANELCLYIAKGKSFPSVFGADVNVQPLFIACLAITVVSCRTGIPQECPLCSLMALYKSIYCYYIIIIFFLLQAVAFMQIAACICISTGRGQCGISPWVAPARM